MPHASIAPYADGAGKVAEAIKGLTPAQLNAFPIPGTWSIQQIVVHLMDSDLIASDRMKRIAAMQRPLLIGYDENAFIRDLHPETLDPHQAAEVFRLNRLLTAQTLRSLPDAAFAREGVHNERGLMTLAGLVESYAKHLEHHLAFIVKKRAMV